MKSLLTLQTIVFLTIAAFFACTFCESPFTLESPRTWTGETVSEIGSFETYAVNDSDGNRYHTVKIGTQGMAEDKFSRLVLRTIAIRFRTLQTSPSGKPLSVRFIAITTMTGMSPNEIRSEMPKLFFERNKSILNRSAHIQYAMFAAEELWADVLCSISPVWRITTRRIKPIEPLQSNFLPWEKVPCLRTSSFDP